MAVVVFEHFLLEGGNNDERGAQMSRGLVTSGSIPSISIR